MNYLEHLYQEVILDHNKTPLNFGELQGDFIVKEGNWAL